MPGTLLEDLADELLRNLSLEGEIQIASLRPHYRFAGIEASDIGNATHRSPYPTLHLSREESVALAVDSFGDTRSISVNQGLQALIRGGCG